MTVKLKICGVTSFEDARAAIDCGAEYLGFIFYPKSLRYIAPPSARAIIERLPDDVISVGVFVNEPRPEDVDEILRVSGARMAQLHGDESPNYCASVGAERVIKALRVDDEFDARRVLDYPTSAILLDAFDAKLYGGTGRTANWTIAREAAKLTRVFLAGGLSPENIVEAIRAVEPFAVDVNSGVESAPGRKDANKLHNLWQQMRRHLCRIIVAFLVMSNLFHLSGVAQTQSSGSLDEGQARKELEAIFAERSDAIKKGDKEKIASFLSPDSIFQLPGGKTLTTQEIEKLALRNTGRSDYREEYVIEEMEVRNGAALVKVRHKESYKQKFRNGEVGDVISSNKRRETWVKTAEGWRLKLIDKLAFGEATLNGKLVNPKDLHKISNLPLLDDQSQRVNPEDKDILQDGQAIAFIYRLNDSAMLLKPPVYLNDQKIAQMRRGRYLKLKLSPGAYLLRSEKEPALSITVEAGRIYYLEVKLPVRFPKAHGLLVLDDGPIGSQINLVPHALDMQPLDADDIKDSSKVISGKK